MSQVQAIQHVEQYSAPRFWSKIRSSAGRAGRGVLEKALCLNYALGAATTPAWAKSAIYGALGYFILPVDAIPDMFVGVGYTDDLLVLAAALATVAALVTPEHVDRAQKTLKTWNL